MTVQSKRSHYALMHLPVLFTQKSYSSFGSEIKLSTLDEMVYSMKGYFLGSKEIVRGPGVR